jgi:hypothetical protein
MKTDFARTQRLGDIDDTAEPGAADNGIDHALGELVRRSGPGVRPHAEPRSLTSNIANGRASANSCPGGDSAAHSLSTFLLRR